MLRIFFANALQAIKSRRSYFGDPLKGLENSLFFESRSRSFARNISIFTPITWMEISGEMLALPVTHSSLFSCSSLSSRLMSRCKGRHTYEWAQSAKWASVDAIFFLLLIVSFHRSRVSLFFGVFEAGHRFSDPHWIYSRYNLQDRPVHSRTTHVHVCVIPGIDREAIDRSRAGSMLFLPFAAGTNSSFCFGLGSLAMPDVVESNLYSSLLLPIFFVIFFFFAISSLFLHRHRSLLRVIAL